jgi:ankyrin repeat protein
LWDAINENRRADVARLLDSGLSVLVTDAHENTLAHLAAAAGHLEIVRLLADRGAPLDRLNWIDQSPLSLAAWKGHLPVVKYLCARGVPTHGRDLNTAPLTAGHLAIVQYLIEQRHVPLNALERPFGATPLFVAASFLRVTVVRYLLLKGADPTMPNAHGETALRRVQHVMQLRPAPPTSARAKRFHDLLICLGGTGAAAPRGAPLPGARAGSPSLLAHLLTPKPEWHYWR